MDQTINQEIIFARLCTGFAILGLAIACVGLYGTVVYSVARRTGEIGIRMALGAQKTDLLRLVLWEGMTLTSAGLASGLVLALSLGGVLRTLVYGLTTTDAMMLIAASILLALLALLATYVPAVRASRIDPKVALRYE